MSDLDKLLKDFSQFLGEQGKSLETALTSIIAAAKAEAISDASNTTTTKISEAKEEIQQAYNEAITRAKNDLVGGAPESVDTLKKLSEKINALGSGSSSSGNSNNIDTDTLLRKIEESGMVGDKGRPDLKPEWNNKPKGTLYKDNSVTDGAFLWLKTGEGNSWKVIGGDTGWITLKKTSSLMSTSNIKIRRLNDTVYFSFDGGPWGWFGITKRGGAGYVAQTSFGNKGCRITLLGGIPEGFRSVSSQVSTTFKDGAAVYGTIYLGGMSDSNFIALSFLNDIPTDRETNDIRVSPINYPTDQAWPRLDVLRRDGFII
jgi:hypothetical protein|nr:MAG TPA: hypothetical protein [Bacteriophage sp.]